MIAHCCEVLLSYRKAINERACVCVCACVRVRAHKQPASCTSSQQRSSELLITPPGKNIPRSATIVFDVEVVDFHNPKDNVVVRITKAAEDCPRKIVETDFVRYHYNGTLVDGTVFDTRWALNLL